MGHKIGLGDAKDVRIDQHGRFHYPLVLKDGEWLGIFSRRTGQQMRFPQNHNAVGFYCNWFNWYQDRATYYLAPDTSAQDHLVSRPQPFQRSGREEG